MYTRLANAGIDYYVVILILNHDEQIDPAASKMQGFPISTWRHTMRPGKQPEVLK